MCSNAKSYLSMAFFRGYAVCMISLDPRSQLEQLIESRKEGYAALSRMLGRNAAYIQQHLRYGRPAKLTARDRRVLSDYFGVDEAVLEGRQAVPQSRVSPAVHDRSELILIPKLNVKVSAGHGALADTEARLGRYGFDRAWLKRMSGGNPENLSIVRVSGDSMAPTLQDGDDILVEQSLESTKVRDGIYVLLRDETLLVKRVALEPMSGKLAISSDNPAYPSWHGCEPREVHILGRVIWSARRHT